MNCSKMWIPKAVSGPTPMLLTIAAFMAFVLGWLCLLHVVFLSRSFMFLVSQTFKNLHCSMGFTHRAPHTILSKDHCLVSQESYCNLNGSLLESTCAFIKPGKPPSPRWCQGLWFTWVVTQGILNHGCTGLRAPVWQGTVNQILGNQFHRYFL